MTCFKCVSELKLHEATFPLQYDRKLDVDIDIRRISSATYKS